MKKVIFAGIALVILGGLGWYLLAHKTKKSSEDMSNMNQAAATAMAAEPVATNTVTIANFSFSPENVTVKTGTTVTWTNNDTAPHTVTETDKLAGPNSERLTKNASYSFTYHEPGTYHYNCSIHPSMTGTVTVTD